MSRKSQITISSSSGSIDKHANSDVDPLRREKLTFTQLKAILKEKGLSTAGNEKTLNERLQRRLDTEEILMNSRYRPEEDREEIQEESPDTEGENEEEENGSENESENAGGEKTTLAAYFALEEKRIEEAQKGEHEEEEDIGDEDSDDEDGCNEKEECECGNGKILVFIKASRGDESEEEEDEDVRLTRRTREINMTKREKKFGVDSSDTIFDDLDARLDSTLDELEKAGKDGISYGILPSDVEGCPEIAPGDSNPYPVVTKTELDHDLEKLVSRNHYIPLPDNIYHGGMFLVEFVTALGIPAGNINYDTRKISFCFPCPSEVKVELDAGTSKKYDVSINGDTLEFRYYHHFPVGYTWFVTASK